MSNARHLEGGFRYKQRTYPLLTVIDGVMEQKIVIDPEFRYYRSWSKAAKAQFIEGVLLGIPVPEVWCEESNHGDIFVLEGAHFVECLIDFYRNKFPLKGVRAIPDLEGCYYNELPFQYANAFSHRTVVEIRIISYDTAPRLKYEFFKLLNMEKRDFIPQVARNYAFPSVAYFLRALREKNEHLVTFQQSANPYTQVSFKRPFEVDRVFLLIVSLVLLKRGFLEPVEGDIEALLDEAMLFLSENSDLFRKLGAEVKSCLEWVTEEGRLPLWVFFGLAKPQFGTSRTLRSEDRINVDGLLYACVQALNDRRFRIDDYISYLKSPTTRRLYEDLL